MIYKMYVKGENYFTAENPPGALIWDEVQNCEKYIWKKDGDDDKMMIKINPVQYSRKANRNARRAHLTRYYPHFIYLK